MLAALEQPKTMDQTRQSLSECHDCGLVQRLPRAEEQAALVACRRCGATLRQVRASSLVLCTICAASGLLLFLLALWLPAVSVWMQGGRYGRSDLLTGPLRLRQSGFWELSLATLATLIVLPLTKLATVVAMAAAVRLGRVPRLLKASFAALPTISEWAMVDVFLLGAMIALFRLKVWMVVSFGPALFALGGSALCSIAVDASLDRFVFWRLVPLVPMKQASAGSGAAASWLGCSGCGRVARLPDRASCRRCERPVHARKPDTLRRTLALIMAAALLAIPANVLPVMTITKLGRGGPSTILGGTVELTQAGLWGLALLVLVASVLVPLFKLGALSYLLLSIRRGSRSGLMFRTRLFRVVALIGRWSMIDIFATMMLVALARFGWLGSVRPGLGASAFCGVVALTMLASKSFDPRAMWDAAGLNPPSEPAAGDDDDEPGLVPA
jgi:paraquat-inducible protein A